MKIAVISPHVDDAVFSVGEHMLSRPDDEFTIVSACGVVPLDGQFIGKYKRLLAEHAEACERGGWEMANGNFVDDAVTKDYLSPHTGDLQELTEWHAETLQRRGVAVSIDKFDEWWVPFGIHHPDHRHVRHAVGQINRPTARVMFYEELPYRVLYPKEATQLTANSLCAEIVGFGPLGQQLEAKQRLCRVYASQIGPDIERSLYAPERLWR